MNVLAFGASNSKTSINKQLATYAAHLVDNATVTTLDLNDFELPLYSTDLEAEIGHPQAAKDFLAQIQAADLVVIAFAEHNGSYTAAYKNLFDWMSRIQQKVFDGKRVVLLATSPGPGGAQTVLAAATGSMPFFGAEVVGSLSVPSFYDNFDVENGTLTNTAIAADVQGLMALDSIIKV